MAKFNPDDGSFGLSADEIIEYLATRSAEQAAAETRERTNFFFTMVGLVVAVFGIVGAGFGAYMFQRVESIADQRSLVRVEAATQVQNAQFERQFAALEERLQRDFASLETALEQRLRDEVAVVTQLPLLVSEVNALTREGNMSSEEGARVLALLQQLAPEIRKLDGAAREIAFRRIENILDAMNNAADYHLVEQVFQLFPDELLAFPGIHYTIATVYATRLLYDEAFVRSRAADLNAFAATVYDSEMAGLHERVSLFHLARDLVETPLSDAALEERCARLTADLGDFDDLFGDLLDILYDEFSPEGANPSVYGINNIERLFAACAA